MLGPNPNPRLFFLDCLPVSHSYAMSISLPPLHFLPATSCLFLLCLFTLRLSELGALGEVAIGAQPPKLGLSLFVCLSFSRTKKPGFPSALEANSLFTPKTSNQN